jgi:cobaltochelatase CobS
MNKEELQNIIETTGNEDIRKMAQAELQKIELAEKAAEGDDFSKTLLALKEAIDVFKKQQPAGTGAGISKEEVEKLIQNVLRKGQISYDDLDPELKAKLAGQVKVQLTLTTPTSSGVSSSATLLQQFERLLFQKVLSDFKARNNVYLYGGAGTGKSYLAEQVADFLGWEFVEVNCNQFTSPLDLVGGQTIEGYQKGKLEMAWTNVDEQGNKMKGAVLCLDELPKLDPNTAGLLNAALAKLKNVKPGSNPFIYNGKGEKIFLANMFVIATGNTKLNETSVEYEANFKQDLSLQDRFAGSTYEIEVDYRTEFDIIMRGFAFIWIYMTKVRQIIIREKLTGFAFVSVRIMQSMRDTYKVFRDIEAQQINPDLTLSKPKTVKNALDSFLNLFKPNQIELIRDESGYEEFLQIVEQKNSLALDALDTERELKTAQEMIKKNEEEQAARIA